MEVVVNISLYLPHIFLSLWHLLFEFPFLFLFFFGHCHSDIFLENFVTKRNGRKSERGGEGEREQGRTRKKGDSVRGCM
jgi:hypothetical protein